jgi:hypothetical protein
MNKLSCWAVMFLLGSQLFPFPRGQDSPFEATKEPYGQVFPHALITPAKRTKSEGYRAVITYGDGFLAAGSGGRIDRISASGEIVKSDTFPGIDFNSLLSDNQAVIAAGDKGALLISTDSGKFRKINSGATGNINSLTIFKGQIIAAADRGEILSGDDNGSFRKIQLALKGNIVSVSARVSECFGVTDKGEIIHSADGIDWDITDFNLVYAGYYKPCSFTAVLAVENRIAVAGIRDDDSPVLMFSNRGGVWTERPLNFTDDQGITDYLTGVPNDIFYDEREDQFYLACNDGKLLKLPSCSHCNKLAVLSVDDLEGISSFENTLMIVGGSFFIKALSKR